MITIPSGARVLLTTRPADFRKGAHGLAALPAAMLGVFAMEHARPGSVPRALVRRCAGWKPGSAFDCCIVLRAASCRPKQVPAC